MPGWGEDDPGWGKDVFEVAESRALELRQDFSFGYFEYRVPIELCPAASLQYYRQASLVPVSSAPPILTSGARGFEIQRLQKHLSPTQGRLAPTQVSLGDAWDTCRDMYGRV